MSAVLEKYELKHPALAIIESDAQNRLYTKNLLELIKESHRSSEDRKYARLLAAPWEHRRLTPDEFGITFVNK
jgi:hypothetical protein